MTDNERFIRSFEQRFRDFLKSERLLTRKDSCLVAMSSGVDSTVLFHCLKQPQLKLAIAHCNYKLRGEDSEKDLEFVRELATEHGVPFHQRSFDLSQYMNSGSIQMKARELRYAFFDEMARKFSYNKIAVGTNLNDQLETVLLNLVKETGIGGLHGIAAKRKKVIRPLVNFPRYEIERYAELKNIRFRQDQSNDKNNYQRNLIRNKIVPVFRQINPNLENTFLKTLEHLKSDEEARNQAVLNACDKVVISNTDHKMVVSVSGLLSFPFSQTLLWELLIDKGFSSHQAAALHDLLKNAQTGKSIQTGNWIALKNRDELILERKTGKPKNIAIEIPSLPFHFNKSFSFSAETTGTRKASNDPKEELIDLENLVFPLTLRNWNHGDKMVPLGMKGTKKISDMLVDEKIDLQQKKRQLVLENGNGKIIWLLGLRLGEEFKLTKNSEQVGLLTYEPQFADVVLSKLKFNR